MNGLERARLLSPSREEAASFEFLPNFLVEENVHECRL
jgi:hypothetical protein